MININTAGTNTDLLFETPFSDTLPLDDDPPDAVVDVVEDVDDDVVVGHVILKPVPSTSMHSELAAVYVNTFVVASQLPFGA
mmetsp:Transcript_68514/g.61560  ORF Transcript_68514/g.61560 Transcript_68514/m.61560 type:complete len:82 (+) Transcript_68514:80-325(+)